MAMDPSKAVKEYKVDLVASQEENKMLTKIVNMTPMKRLYQKFFS
ncbi:MAG: hypothetical protein Q9M14_00695 [Mariprofundaceae bacterium]|nr:hypothetical protein [Mariprofundaceae bacterium]